MKNTTTMYLVCYLTARRTLPLPPGKISKSIVTLFWYFLTLLQKGLMSYRCNSSSPFVKLSKKCQKSVTKDFEISHGGNGSVRLAVRYHVFLCFHRVLLHSTVLWYDVLHCVALRYVLFCSVLLCLCQINKRLGKRVNERVSTVKLQITKKAKAKIALQYFQWQEST